MRVISIGDNVCDKYINIAKRFPGGQALNFAAYAKLLGAEAAYLGVFGSDDCAEMILRFLDRLGIDNTHSRHYEGENGYAEVEVRGGERIFIRSNKGGVACRHHLQLADDLSYIATFDHVHTTNNGYTEEWLGKIKDTGISVSYDFSRSWTDDSELRKLCPHIDFSFLSCSGFSKRIVCKAIDKIVDYGCKKVIATGGENGAVFYDGIERIEYWPQKAKIVDSLGAGDAFAAGFIVSYFKKTKGLMHEDKNRYRQVIAACLEEAGALAKNICMHYGAYEFFEFCN